jgi:hypothetical protein
MVASQCIQNNVRNPKRTRSKTKIEAVIKRKHPKQLKHPTRSPENPTKQR